MSALVSGFIGDDARVDMDALAQRLDEIDDGAVSSARAPYVMASLRLIASDIESELLALRQDCQGSSEFKNSESQLLESAVPEVGKLGVVHHTGRRVGVVRRVLRVLLHRARHLVSSAHGSPSIGAADVAPPAVSAPIAGDGSGAVEHPPAPAPDLTLSWLDRLDGVGNGR